MDSLQQFASSAIVGISLGLKVMLTIKNLALILIGCIIGLLSGRLPERLAGPAVLALLLPVTTALDPNGGLALMTAAILGRLMRPHQLPLGPGTPLRGAAAALLLAVLIAGLAAPVRSLMLMMGPAEWAALLVFGLAALIFWSVTMATVSGVAGGGTVRTVAMVLLGLALAAVGTDVRSGTPRLNFGIAQLADGLDFAVLALGLVGLPALIHGFNGTDAPSYPNRRPRLYWPHELVTLVTVLLLFLFAVPVTPLLALVTATVGGHGLALGPELITRQPQAFWGLFAGSAIAALVAWGLAIFAVRPPWVQVLLRLRLPYWAVVPGLVVLTCLSLGGPDGSTLLDFVVLAVFTGLGAALIAYGFNPALALPAFLIGKALEDKLQAVLAPPPGLGAFLERPGSAVLLAAALALIVATVWRARPSA
jgi:TctA family transporter